MITPESGKKVMGKKAYGSIPHLMGSRKGPKDLGVPQGMHDICTAQTRDYHDLIIVQEKLDGSCCAVQKMVGGEIVPLTRAGYHARTSPFKQHHIFADWVEKEQSRFSLILREGQRCVGEWLAQAHGTRYKLKHEPYVIFDIFSDKNKRLLFGYVSFWVCGIGDFPMPRIISLGHCPLSIEAAMESIKFSGHRAVDPVEGRCGEWNEKARWISSPNMYAMTR